MKPFERKRRAAGLTQQALADKLKVSQRAVAKWERGEALPSPSFIPKLARIFRMTPEEVTHLFDKAPEPATSAA
jgi:transcriptional regulator with XRE-family HTH domain